MNMAIRRLSRSISVCSVTQDDSLIFKLIEKMEIHKEYVYQSSERMALDARAKVYQAVSFISDNI